MMGCQKQNLVGPTSYTLNKCCVIRVILRNLGSPIASRIA